MATEVAMPKWGLTMKEGKISRWFKAEGDPVDKGEPLFEVETSKITNAVAAPAAGILFQIVVPAGETVPVKTVVAVVAEPGEKPQRRRLETAAAAAETTAGKEAATAATRAEGEFVPATPIARRLARERGIDLARVTGTGPKGRVTEKDVRDYNPPAQPGVPASPQAIALAEKAGLDLARITGTGQDGRITKVDVLRAMSGGGAEPEEAKPAAAAASCFQGGIVPFEGMRKVIADNMLASLRQSAQLSVLVELDATAMTDFRDRVRARYAGRQVPKVSYNDIIAVAVCRALRDYPVMNSWLTDEGIVLHDGVNLGVAVALDDGLVVPNVKYADRKSLLELAVAIRSQAGKARDGGLTMDDIQGGTFTISNVSMLGVDGFTPILNPPETAILGVGRALDKAVVVNGQIAVRKMMTLSLTFDHRVVDGAPAMRFLRALADYLEDPVLILA